MAIPTPALDALRDARLATPELKDIRLNLSSVLAGENLTDSQAFGTGLAAGLFLKCQPLAQAIEADMRAGMATAAEPLISDATAAAALMAMNTVYYRFRHMLAKESYGARTPRLRMSRMAQPATSKQFELMSLGCAALAGCELCLQNHEASLIHLGLSEDACHDCIRIAAVMASVSCGLGE